MSSTKALLRIARDNLSMKQYEDAKEATTQVLTFEPTNYTANVFLALILLELGELDQSEKMYRKAIELHPDQLLAWQGLAQLYDRIGRCDAYGDCLEHIVEIHVISADSAKLADSLQKLVQVRRTHGTRLQLIKTLMTILPGSPENAVLSALPEPEAANMTTNFFILNATHTSLLLLEEIVSLLEAEEMSQFEKETENRRIRLGAPKLEQLKKEVLREISDHSDLPRLYHEILSHPDTSDQLRRIVESRLIRYKQRHLYSIPTSKGDVVTKHELSSELDHLIHGVVLLGIPDEFAWTMFLETQNYEEIPEIDGSAIASYIHLFPTSPLSKLLKAYRAPSMINPEAPLGERLMIEPGLNLYDDASDSTSETILGNRILSQLFFDSADYQISIETARRGLNLLKDLEFNSGKSLLRTRIGLQNILATSLINCFPPKHHSKAMSLFNEILTHSPDNVKALMGRGYILEAGQDWMNAQTAFERVAALSPELTLRAREESAWCMCHVKAFDAAATVLHNVLNLLEAEETGGKYLDMARCLWRLGQTYWGYGDSRSEIAYVYFVRSLKMNPTFAPSFTSLGIYYLEFVSPPDPVRSSKCFQKAFEIDPCETTAARHLAEGFAKDGEWDLVEVVARRTIETESTVVPETRETPLALVPLPVNAWAWKAVGVIELNNGNFAAAIYAFQIVLQLDSDDGTLWLRLGEAYSQAGRYEAAVKAFDRCRDLQPNNWLCQYFTGEAKQSLGQLVEAINIFQELHQDRPLDPVVLTSLARARLNHGANELAEGFLRRAETSFIASAMNALKIISSHPGFRSAAWKLISDATYHLSCFSSFTNEDSVVCLLEAINDSLYEQGRILNGFLRLPNLTDRPIRGLHALEISIFSIESRLLVDLTNQTPNPSAWYDLGVSLQAWMAQHPKKNGVNDRIVIYLTQAVKEDSGNCVYWSGLGNAYFSTNVKAAQHCYIKALEIDSKNALIWNNLGLLYLFHEDYDLAQEAFRRAQVLDSYGPASWVGQALIMNIKGSSAGAARLLTHAAELHFPTPEIAYELSHRIFQSNKVQPCDAFGSGMLPAFFLLDGYCARRPNDAAGLHLFGLTCEFLGHINLAQELVERAIVILEGTYELGEDLSVERQYVIANATLGRLDLALGDHRKATSAFKSVLGLLQIKDEVGPTLHAQSHLGMGLIRWLEKDFVNALSLFQRARSVRLDPVLQGHISVLLAQTMWSIGTLECKEMAKTHVLDCISCEPRNLTAISALVGMGLLTGDDDLVDASLAEILVLPIEDRYLLDPEGNVDSLLTYHELNQNHLQKAAVISQKRLFVSPYVPETRNKVASIVLKNGDTATSLSLLRGKTGSSASSSSTSLVLQAVANAMTLGLGNRQLSLRCAEHAIMLTPSQALCWQALSYIQTCKKYQ